MSGIALRNTGSVGEIEIAGERAVCNEHGILYFPEFELLTVSDLHLEKGASFARRGSMVPPYDTQATLLRLAAVIAHYNPRRVISLGDSFHDGKGAAHMPEVFRTELTALMAGREWFWVAGNHDPEPPEDLPGETVQELSIGNLIFRHQPSRAPAAGEIAGHLHPCARIVQRGRSVRRRCFASDGSRLIMPAFGSYTGSLNVLDRAYAGMFEKASLTAYMLGAGRIYAIAGSMLRAG